MDRVARAFGIGVVAGFHAGQLALPQRHYVYLAHCADGSYYCGYAIDPQLRIEKHNAGRGAKILRGKLPVRLAYLRRFVSKGDALRHEITIKSFAHAQKEQLAHGWRSRRRRSKKATR